MRVRATITFEFETPDYLTLAAARGRLIEAARGVPPEFGSAHLAITERRPRSGPRAPAPPVLPSGFDVVRARFIG